MVTAHGADDLGPTSNPTIFGGRDARDRVHLRKSNAIDNVNENDQRDKTLPPRKCGYAKNKWEDCSNHRHENKSAGCVARCKDGSRAHINNQDECDPGPDETGP